jgi:hypothetical protein
MNFVIITLMLLTLITVLLDLGIMIRGGELNKKYGNRMMILRGGVSATTVEPIMLLAIRAGK